MDTWIEDAKKGIFHDDLLEIHNDTYGDTANPQAVADLYTLNTHKDFTRNGWRR